MLDEDNIQFSFLSVKIAGFNKAQTLKWIESVILHEGSVADYIHFIFCTDEYLLEINRKYLQHDDYTDIISFNYNDEFENLAGEIYISYERVLENAANYGVTPEEEMHRIMVHGVLHLLGYDDKTKRDRQIMTNRENFYLAKYNQENQKNSIS